MKGGAPACSRTECEMTVSLDFLGEQQGRILAELVDMRADIRVVSKRLEAIETRFTVLEARFSGLEARFGAIEERLGVIENRLRQ
jgi:predicted  nucleic acid-binding Zn-ribbon protein